MDLVFLSAPRISRAQFARVLTRASSPAAPLADALYDLLVRAGLDPAIALAIFQHESSLGLAGSAARTHNWGNIRVPRRSPAWGHCLNPADRGAMACYAGWLDGLEAWALLITQVYVPSGRATVAAAIPSYAPAGPPDYNQPAIYIAAVERAVAGWQAEDRVMTGTPMRVIWDRTNVRQHPRVSAPSLLRLRAGSTVIVDRIIDDGEPVPLETGGRSPRWARIVSPIEGWVASYLLMEPVV